MVWPLSQHAGFLWPVPSQPGVEHELLFTWSLCRRRCRGARTGSTRWWPATCCVEHHWWNERRKIVRTLLQWNKLVVHELHVLELPCKQITKLCFFVIVGTPAALGSRTFKGDVLNEPLQQLTLSYFHHHRLVMWVGNWVIMDQVYRSEYVTRRASRHCGHTIFNCHLCMKITDVFQFANCENVVAVIAIRYFSKQTIWSKFCVPCIHEAKVHVVQCPLMSQFHSPAEQNYSGSCWCWKHYPGTK